VTHVIPVADGYVIGSSIKSMPIAGKDLTLFTQQVTRRTQPPSPYIPFTRTRLKRFTRLTNPLLTLLCHSFCASVGSPSPPTCRSRWPRRSRSRLTQLSR